MRAEPLFERGEVEDEPGDDDGRFVDLGNFDDALAFGRPQALDELDEGVAMWRAEEMHHDDGTGRGHGMERPNRTITDLLEKLISLVESGVLHRLRDWARSAMRSGDASIEVPAHGSFRPAPRQRTILPAARDPGKSIRPTGWGRGRGVSDRVRRRA
jgi:hypothetical protein